MESSATLPARGGTQTELLHCLLQHKAGLSIDTLAESLGISRNAVRQHLTALERDGLVSKGSMLPSGGRPQQAYTLSSKGREIFPRQYSWFADLLVKDALTAGGEAALERKFKALGKQEGKKLAATLKGEPATVQRFSAVADAMAKLGYHAHFHDAKKGDSALPEIRAYNCVFHDLAQAHPDICALDVAMIENASGSSINHASCMVRGGACCRFVFQNTKPQAKARG
jgi:predicted ArsR family transcriptional regulator